MSQIQSLLESSASGWKNLQSDAAKLAAKWEKTGLLEGLRTETDKNNMSMILENQAKQLVVETSTNPGGGSGNGAGAFTVGQGAEWAGIALPLVRKVFGQIAAKEFVSVQPMNLPSGLVFFLDFQYGTSKTPFSDGQSLYGNTGSAQYPFSTNVDVLDPQANSGGLYGAGRFTYSTNQFSASFNTGSTGFAVNSASWAELNFDSSLSQSIVSGQVLELTIGNVRTALDALDPDAVRGFVPISGSIFTTATSLLPAFTNYNYTANTITFYLTASAAAVTAAVAKFVGSTYLGSWTVFYQKATTMSPYQIGDFEAGNSFAVPNAQSSTQIDIPQININMQSQAIVAKTKKLKAVWTPEFAQDLNAYQALDAEAELTNIMSEYISMEIDLEILDMLIEDAGAGTEYWSAISNEFYNGSNFTQLTATNGGYYNTQGQWFQTLGTKMQKLSNKIHQLTLRGGANFMVCSPTVATVLESIPGYASNSDGAADKMEYAFGVQKAGAINNRYTVYKNPYMVENLILMGFRGTQFLEAGAVFAPYVPLIMTPLIYDPETFTPRKGLLTRYAKKMLRPEFYGKIYVSGLTSF
jgi:hypothetical protein